MGWGGGVYIFDGICKEVLQDEPIDKKELLKKVIDVLQDGDWDTEQDSDYWDHPLVREVFKEKHPDWFDEDE